MSPVSWLLCLLSPAPSKPESWSSEVSRIGVPLMVTGRPSSFGPGRSSVVAFLVVVLELFDAFDEANGDDVADAACRGILEQRHVVTGLVDGAVLRLGRRHLRKFRILIVDRLVRSACGEQHERQSEQEANGLHGAGCSHDYMLFVAYWSIWSVVAIAFEFIS
jgi:hypothetical protein